MIQQNNNDYYVVSIYTNAYLLSKGFRTKRIEKSKDTGKVILYYQDCNDLRNTIREYQNNWDLQDFIRGLKEIKTIFKEAI